MVFRVTGSSTVKLCNGCGDPIVFREERLPDTRGKTRWVLLEASVEDPSRLEHFAQGGEYVETGKSVVKDHRTKPRTLIRHRCNGTHCFSVRERVANGEVRTPDFRAWG